MTYEITAQWRLLRKIIKDEFQPYKDAYNIKGIDLKILLNLYVHPEINTISQIVHMFYLNKGQTSNSMDRLHQRGLVKITPDSNDRRYVHFSLTEEAEEIAKTLHNHRKVMIERISKDIPKEKMQIFYEVLQMMHKNMENYEKEDINHVSNI